MFKNTNQITLLISVILLALNGCRFTSSQRAEDNFNEDKLPPALEKFANFRQAGKYKTEVQKIVKDKDTDGNFKVKAAVIDGGTEIYHPDLIEKIAWRSGGEGKVSLIGYDFMANDTIPTPDRVIPDFFAYGAEEIVDGKIKKAPENPLELMFNHNLSFMNTLLLEIKNNPLLKGSLFAEKFNLNSMTIFDAQIFLMSFDKGIYKLLEASNSLISPSLFKKPLKEWTQFRKNTDHHEKLYYILVKKNWRLTKDIGFPKLHRLSIFNNLEKADVFYKAVEITFQKFEQKASYESAVANYVKFLSARNDDHTQDHESFKIDALQSLSAALYFKLFPDNSFVSISEFAAIIENEIVVRDLEKTGMYKADYTISLERIKQELSELQADFKKFIKFETAASVKDIGFRPQRNVKNIEKHLPGLEELFGQYSTDYDLPNLILKNIQTGLVRSQFELQNGNIADLIYQLPSINPEISNSKIRNYLIEVNHPYIDPESTGHSHGTHTAGIIALDNPNTEIVPIRVTIESIALSENRKTKVKAKYKKELSQWLLKPVVFRSLKYKISDEYNQFKWNEESDLNKNNIVGALIKLWSDEIDAMIDDSSLDQLFMDDMIRAIEYCGKNKIKLANVSLGTNYEAPVESTASQSEEASSENLLKFLEYEFYKWQLAEAIQSKAPQTLFVTALGNENSWVDGKSRSALPVDLSSPFLKKAESELNFISPDNSVSNQILAVVSTNSANELSSFTNIIINNPNLQQILYIGENILSAIRIYDQDGFNQLKGQYMGFVTKIGNLPFSGEWLTPFLNGNKLVFNLYDDSKKNTARASSILKNRIAHYQDLAQKILYDMFIQNKLPYGRMSGTSMATPGVVRRLTYLVADLAKSRGFKSDDEIYDHPDFTPKKVIDLVMSKTIKKDQFNFLPYDSEISQTNAIKQSDVEKLLKKYSDMKN
jgi:subtilisin family serine protease